MHAQGKQWFFLIVIEFSSTTLTEKKFERLRLFLFGLDPNILRTTNCIVIFN